MRVCPVFTDFQKKKKNEQKTKNKLQIMLGSSVRQVYFLNSFYFTQKSAEEQYVKST